MAGKFFVAVADSVFPNLDPATRVLSEIGAELQLAADSSPESVMKLAANPGGRADGNRRQRGSRALTAISVMRR